MPGCQHHPQPPSVPKPKNPTCPSNLFTSFRFSAPMDGCACTCRHAEMFFTLRTSNSEMSATLVHSFIHIHILQEHLWSISVSWALELQLHGIDGPPGPPHFHSSCLVTSLKHPQAQSNSLSSSQPPPCPPSLPMCSFYLQPHVSSVFANAALFPCNTLLSTSTRPSYSCPPRSCSRAPSFSQCFGENCVPLNFICRSSNSQ